MYMKSCTLLLALALGLTGPGDGHKPFTVTSGLFDQSKPDLGLHAAPKSETISIFKPLADTDHFSNGVVLLPFKGRLYAQWQSSPRDEDSQDTWVAYSVSDDGSRWSAPAVLAPAGKSPQMHSSGGWWTDGKTLVAFINVWPTGFQSGEGGYTDYRLSTDGQHWSAPRRVTGKDGKPVPGIIEQDPHAMSGGQLVTAFHMRPGTIVTPFYTDDALGISGWRRGVMQNLPHEGNSSRELEPSTFMRGTCVVMVFRDQAESFQQLASESCDSGQTWTGPAFTGMPDSRAKQSAGNLPDGTAFLVNAPRADRVRIPLAITLSRDGRIFDRAWTLRGTADLQPMRYEGLYKRPGYHYPKSVIWKEHLYVGYATNKEDVELTRVPLVSLRR
ncbi:MAG TPA: sialidase family protein [Steroidobacteraceae bacterium]|nr:sialidase family protein [Steroidobacteraceae bacterium]